MPKVREESGRNGL